MRISYACALVVPLFALSSCEEEASNSVSTETGGEAAGEILGGTISDDMIALEELTSTSPPAERSPIAATGAGQSEEAPEQEAEAPAAQPADPVTAEPLLPIAQTPEAEPSGDGPAS
ncbi:MAG: hypothetical protein AAGI28_13530 [Pseudomonadota bacterium]